MAFTFGIRYTLHWALSLHIITNYASVLKKKTHLQLSVKLIYVLKSLSVVFSDRFKFQSDHSFYQMVTKTNNYRISTQVWQEKCEGEIVKIIIPVCQNTE